MKHNALRSIAHNLTDSFASGTGLLIGMYSMDVFEEVSKTPEGYITVDFLNGTATGGTPTTSLLKAIKLYRDALPDFFRKNRADITSLNRLVATFFNGPEVLIEIEDHHGKSSKDIYLGYPLSRKKVLDNLGRIRRNKK